MSCFFHHKKWSPIDERGYQYCLDCGKAIQAPPPAEKPPCAHAKKTIMDRFELTARFSGVTTGYVYVLSCNECGELINHNVKNGLDLSNFSTQDNK